MHEDILARYEAHVSATYERPDEVTEIASLVAFDFKGETGIRVIPWEDGFILTWTDYVINDWTEFYPSLSVALARLAALIACGETGWEASYSVGPENFTEQATAFFATALN